MKSFWSSQAREVAASAVKFEHKKDRLDESKLRLTVKQNIRADGATSNLFGLTFSPDACVHRYELTVVRKAAVESGRPTPISPSRGWRSFSNGLRRFSQLPPIVRIDNRVYSPQPLSHDMLELPKEYYDIGWQSCHLQPVDKLPFSALPAAELRTLANKIAPWSIGLHAQRDGSFSIARETDSKIVCTCDGLSVGGLRVYRGVTAQSLYIDTGDATPVVTAPRSPPPKATVLRSLATAGPAPPNLMVRCVRLDKSLNYKTHKVQVYTVEDSSGTIPLSVWNREDGVLKPGKVYRINNSNVRISTGRGVLVELSGTSEIVEIEDEAPSSVEAAAAAAAAAAIAAAPPQQLAVKLDTKCLVAAERSLWEEVVQHFGPGPYNEEIQRKIARVVQGTPIVVSTNLRHAVVRQVRFNVNMETVPLEPALKSALALVERGQPFAVLQDHSIVPLQALHCCFDPRMRTWQDITVASCSFVPRKRVDVLSSFRTALEHGYALWGLTLNKEPFVSKRLAILEPPRKENRYGGQAPTPGAAAAPSVPAAPYRPSMPSSIMFCSIASDRASAEEREKIVSTAQHLAKEFRSGFHAHAPSEIEAVSAIDQSLMSNGHLRDPNSAVVLVTNDRDTRANRWLMGECLRRGILPVCIPGVSSGKRQALLAANVRVNLRTKFETNPLKGLNILQEVPALQNKHTLVLGIDCCNTSTATIGAVVGVLIAPQGNSIASTFWRNQVRGQEVEQVAEHFGLIVHKAMQQHRLDEIVVFQDGNVFSELQSMKKRVPVACGLTFMCLHKRTNIRFLYKGKDTTANVTRGSIIQSHTPSPMLYKPLAPSFYMQSHECPMSTARAVEYTTHCVSASLDLADVQRLSHATSHVFAPLATKLPLPTRCAHRLSSIVERIMDASPEFRAEEMPDSLAQRMWYL